MKKQHHKKNCPCRQESWLAKYANHDFDACTCDAFANNELRLMQAYEMACESSIVEMQRKAESIGLTDSEMQYWANRLDDLVFAANEEVTA